MNPKLKLNLAAAGAGIALIGQGSMLSAALAGPTFSANNTQIFSAGANFNLQAGQSFEVVGTTTSVLNPFAVSETPSSVISPTLPVATTPSAGVSTLTAAFDTNGFANTTDLISTNPTPSFAIQAGIIQIGGAGSTSGITTGPVSSGGFPQGIALGLPKVIVLNQGASGSSSAGGVTTIQLQGSGSSTGIIGSNINTEFIGASEASGSFSNSLTVINSLSAF